MRSPPVFLQINGVIGERPDLAEAKMPNRDNFIPYIEE
jgi:hypothetical protein